MTIDPTIPTSPSGPVHDLVIVGAGITGLSAAWQAVSQAPELRITVLDSADRVGGKIRTSPLDLGDGATLPVDEGADAFLARVPEAVDLADELGLEDDLTQPAVGRAKVFVGDELQFLPGDSVLGVPLDPASLQSSGLLSQFGAAEAAAELESDAPAPAGDVAIGTYLTEHYGGELVDRIVGPLIGGINAGDIDELSLAAVTPQLAEAARDGGSLTAALRRRRVEHPPTGPVFHALRGGTGSLVEALETSLRSRGVTIRTAAPVSAITSATNGAGYVVTLEGSAVRIPCDAVVVSAPAPAAASMLSDLSPDASELLARIEYSSVTLVTFVFRRDQVPVPLDASGFLVPRSAGLLMTAASFGSVKWAHWDDGEHVVLRVSAGRAGDERQAGMGEHEIIDALRADLETTMGITARPITARVSRWPLGFAQYTVGHLDRVDQIEQALEHDCPGVVVTGAAYRGLGIPACIRQGRAAAVGLLG